MLGEEEEDDDDAVHRIVHSQDGVDGVLVPHLVVTLEQDIEHATKYDQRVVVDIVGTILDKLRLVIGNVVQETATGITGIGAHVPVVEQVVVNIEEL